MCGSRRAGRDSKVCSVRSRTRVWPVAAHTLLCCRPCFCFCCPAAIELLWADIKRAVAAQYTNETTFEQVRTRLDASFARVAKSTTIIPKIYRHTAEILDDKFIPETRKAYMKAVEKQFEADEHNAVINHHRVDLVVRRVV